MSYVSETNLYIDDMMHVYGSDCTKVFFSSSFLWR